MVAGSKKDRRRRRRSGVESRRVARNRNVGESSIREKPNRYVLDRRADLIAAIIKLYPYQVAQGLAERDEAHWYFGRLFLVGALTVEQLWAAEKLDKVTRRYDYMLRRYGQVHAAGYMKVGGVAVEDLSETAQKRFGKVKAEYDKLYGVLSSCGNSVYQAVIDGLRKDQTTDLLLVRIGLDAISRY